MENRVHEDELLLIRGLRSLFRGVGQVMFQNNGWCGLCLLIGIGWGAWMEGRPQVAWGALLGLVVSTLTGYLLRLPSEDGRQGLWGFNGVLVGCALMTFLRPTPWAWALLILGSAMTVWLREGMNRVLAPVRVNSLTMPFVLTTWIVLLAARAMQGIPTEGLPLPGFPPAVHPYLHTDLSDLVGYWLRGISQVFLLDNRLTGLCFLVGLALSNGWSALWAGFASALSLAFALLWGASGEAISEGLYGFSPVLTGIALGSIFYHPSWRSALWCLVGVVVTLLMQAALNTLLAPIGLPSFTAPFCLATWIFLLPMLDLEPREQHQSAFLPKTDHTDWHPDRKPHLKGRSEGGSEWIR